MFALMYSRHANSHHKLGLLAEVRRYPLWVSAAEVLFKYCNRLVEMEDNRLVEQVSSRALTGAGANCIHFRHQAVNLSIGLLPYLSWLATQRRCAVN